MVAQSLRLYIIGDLFSLEDFVDNSKFTEEIIIKDKSNVSFDFERDILRIWHPKIYTKYHDIEYEKWYLKFLELYHSKLVQYGADDFQLEYYCFYVKQCNIEIFSSELLKEFAKFNVSIPFTCVQYSQKRMKELAKEYNFVYEE